jgi:hypothetical protein
LVTVISSTDTITINSCVTAFSIDVGINLYPNFVYDHTSDIYISRSGSVFYASLIHPLFSGTITVTINFNILGQSVSYTGYIKIDNQNCADGTTSSTVENITWTQNYINAVNLQCFNLFNGPTISLPAIGGKFKNNLCEITPSSNYDSICPRNVKCTKQMDEDFIAGYQSFDNQSQGLPSSMWVSPT